MKSQILLHPSPRTQSLFLFMLLVITAGTLPCLAESPTLNFTPSATLVPAKQGGEGTDVIRVTTGGSFKGNVTMKVSGLPSSVSAWWSNAAITPSGGTAYSTLTVAPSATIAVNWYAFTVTASGDGLSVSKNYAVQVRPQYGVQIGFSSAALTIWHGQGANISVTASPMHGLTLADPSARIVSGLPSGVTASWSQPEAASGGAKTWNLHLSASSAIESGNYPVKVSAQITDPLSGLVYTSTQEFPLLVSVVAAATVDIGGEPGPAIPSTFMGLKHEWWEPIYLMGENATGINPIYRQLLKNLTAYGAGPINVRIGGESTDTSGMPTATTIPPMADLANASGTTFDLSVNLGADNVDLAVDQARAYVSQMPVGSVKAIEVGNEPDLYYRNGFRWSGYTVEDYFSDFEKWRNNIMPVLPADVKLMGPSWASTGMRGYLPTFLSENSSDLSIVSQHNGVTSPSDYPPADILLTPAAATAGPAQAASEVTESHSYGIPFRMGEIGSADDGAIPGISNAFGAALWEIDTMFEYAKVGVDGVNWASSIGDYNNPFIFSTYVSKGVTKFNLTAVTPTYYGMLFFQAATANGSKMLPVNLSTAANIKVWATIDKSDTPRAVVINKETSLNNVSITMPGYNHASVLLLTAPSYTSKSGVTFAGQTFDGSPDGTIQGKQKPETIEGVDGVFEMWINPTSAALLIFSR